MSPPCFAPVRLTSSLPSSRLLSDLLPQSSSAALGVIDDELDFLDTKFGNSFELRLSENGEPQRSDPRRRKEAVQSRVVLV